MPADVRRTKQRDAIRSAIERAGVPVSPKEILSHATSRASGLGLATVYRTIKLMVEAGEVLVVEIPGESPRYELAGKGHHHHFVCKTCKKVYELDGCCGHFAELAPRGFVLEDHELTLFGICLTCVKQAEKPAAVRVSSSKRER
jgi:Fur family transcriptional regulator, ferric uptake regulator